ncbi:MAG TPA: glycosyltransferase [Bryobacteraceae bacterium]|nr:glycosyltransferase [Bryobacteraceae bacterium]
MARVWRILRAIPLLVILPFLVATPMLTLALADLLFLLRRRKPQPVDTRPASHAASVVIPNWNGRDLLEKYLPSVVAALAGNAANEIVVVDNGSSDGSAEFLRQRFPGVKLVALDRNLGFGGGSNAGFRAASNDIVVLLNSDMRVEGDFLAPLLSAFTDERIFAVSCQIFFTDPSRMREETGLTQGSWDRGSLRVRHRIDNTIHEPYPCFYGGGGSCAFDKRKFFALGGFDPLLDPFYLEDTDLGYLAWKRGWKVLYQPNSVVFHEHRGTIGKRFTDAQIQAVLKKNFLLFTWKNIHEWSRLGPHFLYGFAGAAVSLLFGDSPERASVAGFGRALRQLPRAIAARGRAKALAAIDDTEAFRRPLGGYFRDRFGELEPAPERLRVLFVSPYPICPPIHGGGVFMYQTVRQLVKLCELHLIVLLDYPHQQQAHDELSRLCASVAFFARTENPQKTLGSIVPHAVTEFRHADIEWILHRQIYTKQIDVVQLEYTVTAQYGGAYRRIASILFEHDIYFQSIARGLPYMRSLVARLQARFEYLRALKYELKILPRMDRVQVCSRENGEYLESFLPELTGRIDDGLRAGIETSSYEFRPEGRQPATMLFLGSFRHAPNQEALSWFVRNVLPRVREKRPDARLVVIGSDPPPQHSLPQSDGAIDLVGFVEDIREPLASYAIFVCPILSGSGVRVKLLEAFAAGIPVVSTRLGAEGLAREDGQICALADDPAEFAAKIVELFERPEQARALAERARAEVASMRDMRTITEKLVESYRAELARKRGKTMAGLYTI